MNVVPLVLAIPACDTDHTDTVYTVPGLNPLMVSVDGAVLTGVGSGIGGLPPDAVNVSLPPALTIV